MRVTIVVVAIVVSLSGWRWLQQSLQRYVGAGHHRSVAAVSVELLDAPLWMSPMLREELQARVAEQVGADPLDVTGLENAAAALGDSAWVRRVSRLRRVADGRVVVQAEYRRPVALVRGRDGFRPVDGEGVRLPGLYLTHQVQLVDLPVIVGAAARPNRPGEPWPGGDIQAGLGLVRLLEGESYMDQVRAIDVSRRDSRGRLRLVLHTRDGGEVRWGLPPGTEHAVEPDCATKKRWLASVARRRGGIDAGGKIVDLSGAAIFVHQPVSRESARAIDYTW